MKNLDNDTKLQLIKESMPRLDDAMVAMAMKQFSSVLYELANEARRLDAGENGNKLTFALEMGRVLLAEGARRLEQQQSQAARMMQ